MSDNFSGINNISNDYVGRWIETASDFMQGKQSVSISEAKDIFTKMGVEVDDATLQMAEKYDGKEGLSKNEFASIFAFLDGKLKADNKFHFDGYVEDKSEENYNPEMSIANQGTKNEKEFVLGKFHDVSEVSNVHPLIKEIQMNLILENTDAASQIKYAKEQGWNNNAANILCDESGNKIGRIIISYYEAEPGSRATNLFNYRLEAYDTNL